MYLVTNFLYICVYFGWRSNVLEGFTGFRVYTYACIETLLCMNKLCEINLHYVYVVHLLWLCFLNFHFRVHNFQLHTYKGPTLEAPFMLYLSTCTFLNWKLSPIIIEELVCPVRDLRISNWEDLSNKKSLRPCYDLLSNMP